MKICISLITILLVLASCGAKKTLMIDNYDNDQSQVKMDTLHHTQDTDQGIAISGFFFPAPHPEINGDGIMNTAFFGGDARWRSLKFGELESSIYVRNAANVNLSGKYYHSIVNKNKQERYTQFYVVYSYPILKWSINKLTKTSIDFDEQKKHYQTRFLTPIQTSLNLRVGVSNHLAHELVDTSFVIKVLSEKYNSNDLEYLFFGKYVNVEQIPYILRFGIGLKQIQYLFFQGKHHELGSFKGKKNKYSQFYIDALFLMQSNVIEDRYIIDKENDPYQYDDNETIREIVNYTPYLKKRSIGICIGYYKELYINSSNWMFTLKSEAGIRPGYFNSLKSSVYLNLGLGFGGGFGFKHKRKWQDKF